MLAKFRLMCAIMLITSMVGLGIISKLDGDWKVFILGMLYSAANIVIFIL